MNELAPNMDLVCNLYNKKITNICMLSPDWSAKFSFETNLPTFREHLLTEHGVKNANG